MKFQNAQIIGSGITQASYRVQHHSRGERGFIMSRGELMSFMENPRKWLSGWQREDTESTDWGSLVDTLLLSPEGFGDVYAVAPETYTDKKGEEKPWNWNANVCDEWKQKQVGKEVIKSHQLKAAQVAEKAIVQSSAWHLVRSSKKQVMVTADYVDAATGVKVPLKALIDLVPDKNNALWGKSLADFKTCASARPDLFEKSIFRCNYDAQAALYHDMYVAATGEDRPDWVFLAQESSEPYDVADPMPLLSTEFMDIGRAKISFALKFYARCLAMNYWPSYSIGQREEIQGRYIVSPAAYMVDTMAEWHKLPEILHPQPENIESDLIP